jgi:hypothetical protein
MRKKRTLKKLDINSLVEEFEVLDEKQIINTVGGSYYYNKDTGTFFGVTETGNDVRFIDSSEWWHVSSHDVANAGVLFSDSSVNPYAREAILRSLLPDSVQYVSIQPAAASLTGNAPVAFIVMPSGEIIFGYKSLDSLFDDYNNLQSLMIHESYHWNNGHVEGSPNYSGYTNADEVETIMMQINDPSYQDTTNALKIRVAQSLHQKWGTLKNTPGHTMDDAYRIAGVEGYESGYGYSGY